MLAFMPQRIFDGKSRLADTSQSMQRRRTPVFIACQSLVQLFEKFVAAFKKRAERGERKVAGLLARYRWPVFSKDATAKLIGRRKIIAIQFLQAADMLGL